MTSNNMLLSSTKLRNTTTLPPLLSLSSVKISSINHTTTDDSYDPLFNADSSSLINDGYVCPNPQSQHKPGTIGFMLLDESPSSTFQSQTHSQEQHYLPKLPSLVGPRRSQPRASQLSHPYSIANIINPVKSRNHDFLPPTVSSSNFSAQPVLIVPENTLKPNRYGLYPCLTCDRSYDYRHDLYQHQWEHSSYLQQQDDSTMSKKQQIQLLEAAHILYGISGAKADLYV